MCLLMYKPADVCLTRKQLADFHQHNPDGFGIMYADGGRVIVQRTVGGLKKIRKLYRQFADGRDCALHFRYATHGKKDIDNCHPFEVRENLYLMHNGVISLPDIPFVSPHSDTWHFVRGTLAPALDGHPELHRRDAFQKTLGDIIGSGNKLILMDADGAPIIINEHTGVWHEKAWYSNTYAWTNRYSYQWQNWQETEKDGDSWLDYAHGVCGMRDVPTKWENWKRDVRPSVHDYPAHYGNDATMDGAIEDFDTWICNNPDMKSPDYVITQLAATHATADTPAYDIEAELWTMWGEIQHEADYRATLARIGEREDADYSG